MLIESNKTAFYNGLKLKDLLKFIRQYEQKMIEIDLRAKIYSPMFLTSFNDL
jgi:hypothetical protein